MKLSVIVPAYNEAKRIESCLGHLASSLRANAGPGLESEIVVVDNNSTDATAELARLMGARVIFEPVNHIARALMEQGDKDPTGRVIAGTVEMGRFLPSRNPEWVFCWIIHQ